VNAFYDSLTSTSGTVMQRASTSRRGISLWSPLLVLLASCATALPVQADYNSWGISTQEKQIYDYGPGGSNGSSKGGSVLDSTNPIDLMNKIRRGTAMDDATPPGDAVDAALKELDAQGTGVSAQVKAP
jgi:hypothetical protein